MTCMIESHWKRYDPGCMMCREELKEAVKRGVFTKEDYNNWILGKQIIGIPDETRNVVN